MMYQPLFKAHVTRPLPLRAKAPFQAGQAAPPLESRVALNLVARPPCPCSCPICCHSTRTLGPGAAAAWRASIATPRTRYTGHPSIANLRAQFKLRAARKSTDPVCVGERPSQENVAPNMQMAPVLSRPIDDSSGAKRVRKAKRVPRRPASETATRPEVADASRAALAPASPRAGKQRKLSDGSAALLQHCSGVQAANAADRQVSPPIDTVQERFVAYALHAKASAARGSSYLASCAIQADGSRSGEVDYLAHTVAVTRLGQGGYC